jgi:hypothetical protein
MSDYPEFSVQSVADGYWEIYHDDDCGELVVDRHCVKCKFFVDMQSLGARKTGKAYAGEDAKGARSASKSDEPCSTHGTGASSRNGVCCQ